jgi:hypothetical protein
MLSENQLQLNSPFLFSFNPITIGLSPFTGFRQPIQPIILQNSKKQRVQNMGEE